MTWLVDCLGARVEQALARTQLQNALAALFSQWRQHLVNLLAVSAGLFVLWQATPASHPGMWRAYANWALPVVCIGYLLVLVQRLRADYLHLKSDWLSVQPIAFEARLRWLRTRAALRSCAELVVLSFIQAHLFGGQSASALLLIGACGTAVVIQLAPSFGTSTLTASVVAQASYAAADRPALQAWFYSEIPGAARRRWWWLAVALMVPMSSSLIIIGLLAIAVAAALRAYGVLQANAKTLFDTSRLLQSQPLPPRMLFRAAMAFVARALVPSATVLLGLLVLICQFRAMSFWLLPLGLLLAVLVAATALHFAFGYRLTALHSLRRARAATGCVLAFALLLQMLAPAIPLFCIALWRFHYLRGMRALEIK